MSMRVSRRTLMALTGGAALGVGTAGWAVANAQTTASPHSFPNGQVLTWADPWVITESSTAADILPNSVSLEGGNLGEAVFGFYDAPQTIDDVASAFLALGLGDASLAELVAGGEEQTVAAGGAVEASSMYQVYRMTVDDAQWGFYVSLTDEVAVGILAAPVAAFASEMESVQASVQLDGVGVFGGANGAEFQANLEGTASIVDSGEYTDLTGFLHVTWTNGWTDVASDDKGIQLTDPTNSTVVYIASYPVEGHTWQELADLDTSYMFDDQGADATLVGPVVTDSGFSLVTDGDYGLRFAQGSGTESPDVYVLAFAADFPEGTDPAAAIALVQEAQAAVMVNGVPVLQGLEELA